MTLLGSPDNTSLDLHLILAASSRSRSPCSRAHTCSLVSVFLQKLYCVFLHTASSRISVFSLLVLITHVLCFLCLFLCFSLSVFCFALSFVLSQNQFNHFVFCISLFLFLLFCPTSTTCVHTHTHTKDTPKKNIQKKRKETYIYVYIY